MKNTITISGTMLSLLATQFLNGQEKVPTATKPNILFIMADQHNADVLGFMGHPDVKTPNLDALAADGAFYSRAYCMNGVSVASRASIITGRYIRDLELYDNVLTGRPHSFSYFPLHHELKLNGYINGNFGKRHLPEIMAQGFDKTATTGSIGQDPSDENYEDWMNSIGRGDEYIHDFVTTEEIDSMCMSLSPSKSDNRNGAYNVKNSIEFIKTAQTSGKPFFCMTSFLHPHQPYTPNAEYASMYNPDSIQLPASLYENYLNLPTALQAWRTRLTPIWCLGAAAKNPMLYKQYIAYYYALVSEVDNQVGQLIKYLKDNGLYDNTIIVYVSDHGDFVGGHGMIEKCAAGHNVYEETLRVPLIIKPVGSCVKGERKDLVQLIDIYPTLLEMSNIVKRDTCSNVGISLVNNITNNTPLGRQYAISENGIQISVITDRYKYGEWINPTSAFMAKNKHYFFDRQTDPHELTNQIDNGSYSTQKALLKSYLAQYSAKIDTFWNSLNITYSSGQSFVKVINNISLPKTYKGVSLTWSSNNPTILSNTGAVNITPLTFDTWVNLSATAVVNGKSKTESFAHKVICTKKAIKGTTIPNAQLNYVDASGKNVTADLTTGAYSISVPIGWSGIIKPVLAGYSFSPASMAFTNVTTQQNSKDFTATPVVKSTPVITWQTPTDIVKGTPLSATQLNATASVPGYFTYNPTLNKILELGTQTLNVSFEPRDLANNLVVTKTITINVVDPNGFNSIFTNDQMIKAFQSPTGTIKIVINVESNQHISIYSLVGQQIYHKNISGKELEVSLPKGVYVVNVSNEYGNFNKKIMVINN
jgi:arylsulfatase A-like enzyme